MSDQDPLLSYRFLVTLDSADAYLPPAQAELAFIKDQLSQQVTGLTQLHQLAMELGGITELDPALDKILETAVDAQGADFGLVWLHDGRIDQDRLCSG